MVHDQAPGIAGAHTLEEAELERLGLLEAIGGNGVDDRDPEGLVVGEEGLRVEQHPPVPARVGGRARAVHDHGVTGPSISRVERVARVIDLLPGEAAAVELFEEPARPLRMLIQDADGAGQQGCHERILR
jgi:hypothetical protein